METNEEHIIFDASDYNYKISEFLDIPIEEVQNTIKYLSSEKIKKFAFLGDSYLGNITAMILDNLYHSAESVNFLSCLKAFLVCNKTLSNLCDTLFYGDIKYTKSLNDHSKGTIFEALLHISLKYNTNQQIYNKIKHLFKSIIINDNVKIIKENIDLEEFMKINSVKSDFINNKEYTKIHKLLDENISSLNLRILNIEKEKFLRPLEVKNILSSVISRNERMNHTGENMNCSWRSRKGIYHTNYFYSCCGTPVLSKGYSYNIVCPRSNWSNPLSYHTGLLNLNSSRKLGGGIPPRGSTDDHIPHCRTPYWTCCSRDADSEGCRNIKKPLNEIEF